MRITADDITALRQQGDFREFLRAQFGTVDTTTPTAAPEAAADDPQPETYRPRPGVWPTGTRPPSPVGELPAALWTQAVHDYRAWQAAGQPPTPIRCECGCTPGVRKEANP